MKRSILGLFLFMLCFSAYAQKQRFFNLTVEDVTIDSVLPRFTYSIPIGENYADSTYQLEIRYPEFIDMNKRDVALYHALTAEVPPALPEIYQQIVVERKRGALEFSLVPIVERGGKKQFLVSFMIALTSKPVSYNKKARGLRAAKVPAGMPKYAEQRTFFLFQSFHSISDLGSFSLRFS